MHAATVMNTDKRPLPAQKKDQNSHILTVMGVDIGAHAVPLIQIQTCTKCAWLARTYNGFAYKVFPVQGSRATMMRADIMGCRVEWVERGR